MNDRRVVYIEHARAVRRYLHAIDRLNQIENDAEWRFSPAYFKTLEAAEFHAEKCKEEIARLRQELKLSKNTLDKVYYYTTVEHQKPSYVAKKVDYCERQVYRFIKQIQDKIREDVTN